MRRLTPQRSCHRLTGLIAPAQGFTLIEVLMAVSILGIVLTAVYSTFFLVERAVSATNSGLVRLQEARFFLDVLKREVEASFVNERSYTLFKVEDRDYYGRQASRLELTSFSGPIPGLTRVQYTVEERGGSLVLRKRVSSAYSSAPLTEPEDLIEDVQSFTVELRHDDRWVRTWDSGLTARQPAEVRLSLALGRAPHTSAGTQTPPVVLSETARPRIGGKW